MCNLEHAELVNYATHVGSGTHEDVMHDLNENESADLVILRVTDNNFLDSIIGRPYEKIILLRSKRSR